MCFTSAPRHENRTQTDEPDAGDARGVDGLTEPEVARDQHEHVGDTQERIREADVDPREGNQMQTHAEDQDRQAADHIRVERDDGQHLQQAPARKVEAADGVHPVLEQQLRDGIGGDDREDQGDVAMHGEPVTSGAGGTYRNVVICAVILPGERKARAIRHLKVVGPANGPAGSFYRVSNDLPKQIKKQPQVIARLKAKIRTFRLAPVTFQS
jgi:hypothetical protein